MKSEKESPKSEKVVKYLPTVRFDEDDLPELTGWKVGGKYKLTLEVEQVSMSKGEENTEDTPAKPKTAASFKIISVQPLGGSNLKNPKRPSILTNAMKKRI